MSDFISLAQTFLTGGWRMMLETKIPGLDVSFAGFGLALLLISFSVRILGFFTGFRMGSYGAAADAVEKAKSARKTANNHRWNQQTKSSWYSWRK